MKELFLILLLISISSEEGTLKKSERSKHGEDCVSDSACEEGLICKLYRCMTNYEFKNMKLLGLSENNICDQNNQCKGNESCLKHRCVNNSTIITKNNNTENEIDISLLFAGSIYLSQKSYKSGVKENDIFNYTHLFTHILDDIKTSDLSIVEQGTIFHIIPGEKKYPKKSANTPKEIGDAIANAGFKVVLHGTNYAFSHKEKGINNTLNFWKTKYPNIRPLGISSTVAESEKDYFIYTRENLKIGIINFATFSSNSIPKKSKFMVNTLNQKRAEELVAKVKKEADFVIACVNWGDKNSKTPDKKQINFAKLLASNGVDLIIGNYPNFVNPVSFVKAENGRKILVFWSLGLFVGDNKKQFSNIGALANVVVSKGNGNAYLSSYNLIPIINHKVDNENYSVYKLSDYTEELGLQTEKKFSMKKVRENCAKVMGAFAHCD